MDIGQYEFCFVLLEELTPEVLQAF